MSYDIFKCYNLDKVKDSLTENFDYKDVDTKWELVSCKDVLDSDGFQTEYCWYTDGTKHIFMFGDSEIYQPDEDYADWETESEQEAKDWFENYKGFELEDDFDIDSLELDEDFHGNADFMNDGFARIYGLVEDIEE